MTEPRLRWMTDKHYRVFVCNHGKVAIRTHWGGKDHPLMKWDICLGGFVGPDGRRYDLSVYRGTQIMMARATFGPGAEDGISCHWDTHNARDMPLLVWRACRAREASRLAADGQFAPWGAEHHREQAARYRVRRWRTR